MSTLFMKKKPGISGSFFTGDAVARTSAALIRTEFFIEIAVSLENKGL
jgi:hypothetical protein